MRQTEQSLFRAFRSELNYKDYPYSFPDRVLEVLLATIKGRHPDIAHCNGQKLEFFLRNHHAPK